MIFNEFALSSPDYPLFCARKLRWVITFHISNDILLKCLKPNSHLSKRNDMNGKNSKYLTTLCLYDVFLRFPRKSNPMFL